MTYCMCESSFCSFLHIVTEMYFSAVFMYILATGKDKMPGFICRTENICFVLFSI